MEQNLNLPIHLKYSWPVLMLALLSLADALFTVYFLNHGASEANPFLHWVLTHSGVLGFMATKIFFTASCCLVLYRHCRLAISRKLIPLALGVYALIVAQHLIML